MDTNPVEYWNAQARDYDDNIFSTIDEDKTGVIMRTLQSFASAEDEGPLGRCIDLGCGAGKYLPALAARFRKVAAYDLSPKLVGLARREVQRLGLRNVDVAVRDLALLWYRAAFGAAGAAEVSGEAEEMESYGFAVMANVLIAPVNDSVRALMLRNAFRCLCHGGRMLAVVPSVESALYVNMRCEEARYEGPYAAAAGSCTAAGDVLRRPSRAVGADLLQGILKRSGVRTKHFLEPEFRLLATRVGFSVVSCEKIEYHWRSELGLDSDSQVPATLREPPLPWDWLFLLQRAHPDGSTTGPTPQPPAPAAVSSAAPPPAAERLPAAPLAPAARLATPRLASGNLPDIRGEAPYVAVEAGGRATPSAMAEAPQTAARAAARTPEVPESCSEMRALGSAQAQGVRALRSAMPELPQAVARTSRTLDKKSLDDLLASGAPLSNGFSGLTGALSPGGRAPL